MDIVLHQRAQSIFDEVVELPTSERRGAMRAACAGDIELLALVEELLSLDAEGEEDLVGVVDEAAVAQAVGPVPLEPGVRVDRYVVTRLLGVGGTARVWEVQHRALGTRQALKVLTWAEPRMQRRLLREARTQARLGHPNLVPVSDVVEVHGAPGLLMPLILGPPLDELLSEYRPSVGEALALIRGTCEGMAHAHAQGFAHRDLKPANVLLDIQGELLVPRVADFGLVKGAGQKTMTRPGMVMGTLSYAAPEQLFDTSTAAEPADVWALGVLSYELLTSERPFRGSTLQDILDAHEAGPDLALLPEGLPGEVVELIGRMLSPAPELRPQTAAEVLEGLPETQPLRLVGPIELAVRELQGDHHQRDLSSITGGSPSTEELFSDIVSPSGRQQPRQSTHAPSGAASPRRAEETIYDLEEASGALEPVPEDDTSRASVGEPVSPRAGAAEASMMPSTAATSAQQGQRRGWSWAVPLGLVAVAGIGALLWGSWSPGGGTATTGVGAQGGEVVDEGGPEALAPPPGGSVQSAATAPSSAGSRELEVAGVGPGEEDGDDVAPGSAAEGAPEAGGSGAPGDVASVSTSSVGPRAEPEENGSSGGAADDEPAVPMGEGGEAGAPGSGGAAEPSGSGGLEEEDRTIDESSSAGEASAEEIWAQPNPTGVVRVLGGPSTQRLVSEDGRLFSPGTVPSGRYRFEAQMEKRGNWVGLDLPELAAGGTITVACFHDFGYCKVDGS